MTKERLLTKRQIKTILFNKYGDLSRTDNVTDFRVTCPCFFCGKPLTFNKATIEHLIPLSLDGTWDIENLRISCSPCNNTRGVEDWELFLKRIQVIKGYA